MAFPTEAQLSQATGLIVAMFNAAPGKEVLGDVAGALAAGASLQSVANILATKPQFAEVYPNVQTVAAFADAVVANLLTASTSAAAVTWTKNWITTELAKPGATRQKILVDAATALSVTTDPAFADAKAQFANRVDVAKYYSIEKLQPSTDLAGLQAVLAGVTNDPATVDAAMDAVDGNLAGQDFTLTVGPDSFTGGTGADVFTAIPVNPTTGAAADTLSTFDKLDGGLGNDTLNIFAEGGNNGGIQAGSTITNIETINIASTDGSFGPVDASVFVGATSINQIGTADVVTGLGAGTTAGFNDVGVGATLSVEAADDAASAAVALTKVDETSTLDVTATATGTLNDVTISGAVVDGADAGSSVSALVTSITVGKDVQTLTLNSSVAIDLTVNDGAGTKKVTTIDAAASTGDITLAAAATVLDISTGSGDDTLTVDVATPTKAVTVDTGAGDDSVAVAIDALVSGDVIDGGEGYDSVVTAATALTNTQYINLGAELVNFEALQFTAAATLDAKAVPTSFKDFTFDVGGTANNVLNGQTLTTGGSLTAKADGYSAPAAKAATYAGTLDVTSTDTATITAHAETVNLTVDGDGIASNAATLVGDVKTAVVVLTEETDDLTVATVDDADGFAITTLDALTSLTISGAGTATVTNGVSTVLVTVDASGLEGGLTYESFNTKAETISLGEGDDVVTLDATASTAGSVVGGVLTLDKMDTIKNFDVANDQLILGATGFVVVEATGNSLSAAINNVAQGADDNAVFTYGGDAYILIDANTADVLDAADVLVKLVGISSTADLEDLAALIA